MDLSAIRPYMFEPESEEGFNVKEPLVLQCLETNVSGWEVTLVLYDFFCRFSLIQK